MPKKLQLKHDIIVNCYKQDEIVGTYMVTSDHQPTVEEVQFVYETALKKLPEGRKKIKIEPYYLIPEN